MVKPWGQCSHQEGVHRCHEEDEKHEVEHVLLERTGPVEVAEVVLVLSNLRRDGCETLEGVRSRTCTVFGARHTV